jgi:biopolymer transport protein ExbD
MALQSKNRVNVNFSMSGMTDIVFLLLIFFMLTSTLLAPNALKLLFPSKRSEYCYITTYSGGKANSRREYFSG